MTCLGFEENRHDELGVRLPGYLDLLHILFPNRVTVFNTKDRDATSRSGWWRDWVASEVRASQAETTERFTRYASGRSNGFVIRHEDMISENEWLRELFEFLGADHHEDRIDTVLEYLLMSVRPDHPAKALLRSS